MTQATRRDSIEVKVAWAVLMLLVAELIFLGGRTLSSTQFSGSRRPNETGSLTDPRTKQYNPTFEITCGEPFGPDLKEMTRIDRAIFVMPPNCTSGMIMVPKNTINVVISTESHAPVMGHWYDQKPGQNNASGNTPLSAFTKIPFADEENGMMHHVWGIPVAFDLQNLQQEKVAVIATFSLRPLLQ